MVTDARRYLISFLATLKGDKAVITGLRGMQRELNKSKKAMGMTGKAGKSMGDVIGNLAKRALLTIPVWLAFRAVLMGIVRTIGNMIRANLDFEDGLARIRTVMQGTAGAINRDIAIMKNVILDMASKTSLGLKDLSEVMYYLKTANLSALESMSAFPHVVQAVLGTGADVKTMVRAIAGAYNTMGKYMDSALTPFEKFQEIADALTYTFATQEVEMNELVAGYTKFAPYVSGLEDDFTTLITIIGVLNTKMLKSGRTGRLLGRAILQISKNSKKLSSIFDIAFDPDKPINFLNLLENIASKMKEGAKLTKKQGDAIQEVFATRAGVPIRLLVKDMETLIDAVKRAGVEASGFTKKIAEIRELTITRQMKRMGNILSVLSNNFMSGVYGAGSFAYSLQQLNDTLAKAGLPLKRYGQLIGWLWTNIARLALVMEEFSKVMKAPTGELWNKIKPDLNPLVKAFEEIEKAKLEPLTWQKFLKENEIAVDQFNTLKETIEEIEKKSEEQIKNSKIQLDREKKRKEYIRHQVALLKAYGIHEKNIIEYKLEQLDISEDYASVEEKEFERRKLINQLWEAQTKYQREMKDNLQTSILQLLKQMGASETQILEIKIQQLYADRENIGNVRFMLELTKLRRQQQISLLKEKQKELDIVSSLYIEYKKADEFEKARIRRVAELRKLSAQELAKRYEDPYDQRIIDEYFRHFSEQGQDAIKKVRAKMFEDILGFDPTITPGITVTDELKDQLRELLSAPDLVTTFWDNWTSRGRDALKEFSKDFGRIFSEEQGAGVMGRTIKDRIAFDQHVDLSTKIGIVEITLPENALDNVAEEAGNQLKEALLSNEEFQKKFVERIRKLI